MQRTSLVLCALLVAAGSLQASPLAPRIAKPAVALVSWMTGIPFTREVPIADLSVEETRTYLETQIKEEAVKVDMAGQVELLTRLGFLAPGVDFVKSYLDLLGAQVAAFYDLKTGRFYNVNRFGFVDVLSEPVTVSHELSHAAQDQARAVQVLFEDRKDDDDRLKGVQWVMEGQATILGNRAGNLMWPIPGPPGLLVGEISTVMLWTPPMHGLARLSMLGVDPEHPQVPPYLVDSLLDAYLEGSKFVWTVERALGQRAHGWLICHPPQSTEQMLHPEKYLRGEDPPLKVDVPTLAGRKVRTSLTMGEWGLRWLLAQRGREDLAQGWGGDRAALMEDGTAVWRIVMDDTQHARALATGLQDVLPNVGHVLVDGREVHLFPGLEDAAAHARSLELLQTPPSYHPADPPPPPGSYCSALPVGSRSR